MPLLDSLKNNIVNSLAASTIRFWGGTNVCYPAQKPLKNLELFDVENGPQCRLVREVLTELDLDVMVYPCPKGGKRFRPLAQKKWKTNIYPQLFDPNTKEHLAGAQEIIEHLYETYAKMSIPLKWNFNFIQDTTSLVTSLMRWGHGLKAETSSKLPSKPLELYSFESSPYARPVRELLCELEIPYLLHNVGKSDLVDFIIPPIRDRLFKKRKVTSENRKKFLKRSGRLMVPYLVDPNTNMSLFESDKICRYLKATYN